MVSDPKAPAPVVPADLDRTQAVRPDADGNVPCIRCGALTPFETARIVGSDGFSCGRCERNAVMAPALHDVSLRGPRWPWLLAIAAVVGVVVAVIALSGGHSEPAAPVAPFAEALELVERHPELLAPPAAEAAEERRGSGSGSDGEAVPSEKVRALGFQRDPSKFYIVFDGDVYAMPRRESGTTLIISDDHADWAKVRETGVVEQPGFIYFLDGDGDLARTPSR